MKLFKKLLAAALAGVLALTLLAGCSGGGYTLDSAELVAALNDLNSGFFLEGEGVDTFISGDSALAQAAIGKLNSYVRAKGIPDEKVNETLYKVLYSDAEKDFEFRKDNRFKDAAEVYTLLASDTTSNYYFCFRKLEDFQSRQYRNDPEYHLAEMLICQNGYTELASCDAAHVSTGIVSAATGKIGNCDYLVVIIEQKAA